MAKAAALMKYPETSKLGTKPKAGRVFVISMDGVPRVNAGTKARLEAAARRPSKLRDYPQLIVE